MAQDAQKELVVLWPIGRVQHVLRRLPRARLDEIDVGLADRSRERFVDPVRGAEATHTGEVARPSQRSDVWAGEAHRHDV